MTRIVAYPAVLDDRDNGKGEYTVTFPDVQGAITEGNGVAPALENAATALGLILFDEDQLPQSTPLATVQQDNPGTIVSYVTVDLDQAKRQAKIPMVRKNTRIPADLAEAAEAQGINFSATLTAALREKLHLD